MGHPATKPSGGGGANRMLPLHRVVSVTLARQMGYKKVGLARQGVVQLMGCAGQHVPAAKTRPYSHQGRV